MRRFQKSTIRDVAERAGVSITTVSHVVHGKASACSKETKKRVEEAIQQLQYTPNSLSQSLHQKGTGIIGVGVQPPTNIKQFGSAFAEQVWLGLSQAADYLGTSLLQFPSVIRDNIACEPFLNGQIDGLILSENSDNTRLDALERAGLPTVTITRSRNFPTSIGAVFANEEDVVRLALDHLRSLGHTRIAHVAGPIEQKQRPGEVLHVNDIALWRHDAFATSMREQHASPPLISGGLSWSHQDDASTLLRDWLSLPEPPTALFCANDQIAQEMVVAARSLGREVPKDLSIVGVDNTSLPDTTNLSLTTIEIPSFDIGYESLFCLQRLRSGSPIEQCRVMLPVTRLVPGESTAPPPSHKK